MPGLFHRSKTREGRLRDMEAAWEPEWLRHGVVAGDLPWDKAQQTTMATLLASYSLHDSYWLGQWLLPGQGLVGVIRWTIWTINFTDPDWMPFSERVGPTPFLLLCFPQLYRLDQEVPMDADDPFLYLTLIRAESRELAGGDVRQVLWPSDDERSYGLQGPVCETIFNGVESYRLRLVHGSLISVLAFDSSGVQARVPRL